MKTLDELLLWMREVQGELLDFQFAAKLGISPSYLHNLYHKKQSPGPKVLEALKHQKVILYIGKE